MFLGIENAFIFGYVILGIVTAAVTMRIFPPMEGFRPGASTLVTACAIFVLLWPVLVLLAVWYGLTTCSRKHRKSVAYSSAPLDLSGTVHGIPAKPR